MQEYASGDPCYANAGVRVRRPVLRACVRESLANGFEIRYNERGSVPSRFEWISKSDAGHEVP